MARIRHTCITIPYCVGKSPDGGTSAWLIRHDLVELSEALLVGVTAARLACDAHRIRGSAEVSRPNVPLHVRPAGIAPGLEVVERVGAVPEGSVRDIEPARSDVAIAGGQDASQRSGRRPVPLPRCSPTFAGTSSTSWISKEPSKSGICDFQGSAAAVGPAGHPGGYRCRRIDCVAAARHLRL